MANLSSQPASQPGNHHYMQAIATKCRQSPPHAGNHHYSSWAPTLLALLSLMHPSAHYTAGSEPSIWMWYTPTSTSSSSLATCSAEGRRLGSISQHLCTNCHRGGGHLDGETGGRVQPCTASSSTMASWPMSPQGLVPEHISQITTPRE